MLGILCGLESEAKCARRLPGVVVALSAANPQKARAEANRLVNEGCTHLISYGIAGGLAPDLGPGSCVIGTEVMTGEARWPCDPVWSEQLRQINPHCRMGVVYGTDRVLGQSTDKKRLFSETNALITDMESHVVAEVAHNRGIPYAVLRVVTDTVDLSMPPAALVPLKEDGSSDIWGVMRSFVSNPGQLGATIKLALNMGKALRSLGLYKVTAVS